MSQENSSHIVVVDDDPTVLESVFTLLSGFGYTVTPFNNGADAIGVIEEQVVDVVLTDIIMPDYSGLDLLEGIRKSAPEIPVILMTAYADLDVAVEAIKKGAYDFIAKPFKSEYLKYVVGRAINHSMLSHTEKNYKLLLEKTVKEKMREVSELSREIIQRFTSVAEFRDTDTGAHIERIGIYCGKIAEELGMSNEYIEQITLASSLHDIGKIGIPDSILLKPSSLTKEEFEIMKTHTTIGARMFADSSHPFFQMAESIALNHHEKWDGTGYPRGLKGEDIPLEGRIVIICDQYDALMSKRPYKAAIEHEEAFRIITEGSERANPTQYEPKVLKAFEKVAPTFEAVYFMHQD